MGGSPRSIECPSCGSSEPVYRNPVGTHGVEDPEPEDYEWCVDRWHEPYFFSPPIEGQRLREAAGNP